MNSRLICFYRISDSFQKTVKEDGSLLIKDKPDYITKRNCFLNFVKIFGINNLYVVADNICEDTFNFLTNHVSKEQVLLTNIGHGAGSFMFALKKTFNHIFHDNDMIYFVEDDYVHMPNSPKYIIEGLEIADYVTLYDHPDKYVNYGEVKNGCAGNPYIYNNSEQTRVYLTESIHWKKTNSTTMTFASRVKTLKEDFNIIKNYCSGTFPHDFYMFRRIIEANNRLLISSLPGMSTHGETKHLSPLTDWSKHI